MTTFACMVQNNQEIVKETIYEGILKVAWVLYYIAKIMGAKHMQKATCKDKLLSVWGLTSGKNKNSYSVIYMEITVWKTKYRNGNLQKWIEVLGGFFGSLLLVWLSQFNSHLVFPLPNYLSKLITERVFSETYHFN